MNVADVYAFTKVASTGSFSEAAEQLGVTRSAVSKSLSRLERDLGVILIRRTPRSFSLTEAGHTFNRHAVVAEEAMARAVASIHGADQSPSGNVSCTLPSSMGAALLPLLIRDFQRDWPELRFNLHFDESIADLVSGSYDVGIRIAQKLHDSNLLARRLGTTQQVLVASPGYLAEHGTPVHVRDLPSHRCLGIGHATRSRRVWRFGPPDRPTEVTVDCRMTANIDLALIVAACMGDGILCVPRLSVGGELARGRLREILPEFCREQLLGVYAVHPYRTPPAKVQLFIDFVEKCLPQLETVDRWSAVSGDENGAGS